MRNVQVAFLTVVDPTGRTGQSIFSREIATALSRVPGIELLVVCPQPASPDHPCFTELAARGATFAFLPSKVSRSIRWHGKVQFAIARALRRAARQPRGLDLIVTTSRPALLSLPLTCRRLGLPVVLLKEGGEGRNLRRVTRTPVAPLIARIAVRANVLYARRVYAFSRASAAEALSFRGVSAAKVRTVYHGVDPALFPQVDRLEARRRVADWLGEEDFVIGFAGSFRPYHCLDQLLGALKTPNLLHAKALLVGDGPERRRSEMSVRRAGLSNRVAFLGFVDHREVVHYMGACDVLYGIIDPVHGEPPMKIAEYMACGRPTLALQSPDLAFVGEIGAGLLVKEPNTGSVAQALCEIDRLSARARANMGDKARRYVLDNCTWNRLAEELVDVGLDR